MTSPEVSRASSRKVASPLGSGGLECLACHRGRASESLYAVGKQADDVRGEKIGCPDRALAPPRFVGSDEHSDSTRSRRRAAISMFRARLGRVAGGGGWIARSFVAASKPGA